MKNLIIMGAIAVLCGNFASAQEMTEEEYLAALEEALPGKLMNNPLDPQWQVYGEDAQKRVVDAEIPGQKAFRVKVKKAKSNPYDIAVQGNVRDAIEEGDVVLVAFWARAQSPSKTTGSGHMQFRLQKREAPYTGIVEGNVLLREEWQIHYLSGVASETYPAGGVSASFNVGHHAQTVELGQFYVMDMGPDVDPADLPSGSVDP
ncbi:carbohydrate binding domain-containing protein [Parvularcula marina]|uniref:Uncharacterized protein n=1 Tax=Parvularcula marina TaxID=2292771 RepID=A0A371RFV3_9PROT|nr:carbohydrate binding domain-containing protein [Parvularcula marina]RFB04316.1 hypothetical protein DX908_02870 [Parvularcula marina]